MEMDRHHGDARNGTYAESHLAPDIEVEASAPTPAPDAPEPDWRPSPDWLAGEDRADDDIRAGRVRRFASVEDVLADLHAASTESKRGAD